MSHVLVACAKRYNGHELWTLLGVLHERDHTFEVVSQEKLVRDELTLRPNILDRTLYEVVPGEHENYDCMLVVSGNMDDTEAYWTDPHMELLLRTFRDAGRVVGAICCSVPTLAPIARGVKVSYFPLVRSKHRLEKFGAVLQPTSLTVDQKIVTAENQMMTTAWAIEICNLLEGKPPTFNFTPSGFVPKGTPRILPDDVQDMIDKARVARGMEPMPPPPADKVRPKKKSDS